MVKRILSAFMVVLLVHQVSHAQPAEASKQSVKETRRTANIKAKVEGLGVAAEILVAMRAGGEHRGRIETIGDESLQLTIKGERRELRYSDISTLNLVNAKYKAAGQIDPVSVRRVVFDVGVGNTAKMKLGAESKITGKIQSIEKDGFTLVQSGSGKRSVFFTQVTEIEKKQVSHRTKVIVAACVGTLVGLLVVGGAIAFSR